MDNGLSPQYARARINYLTSKIRELLLKINSYSLPNVNNQHLEELIKERDQLLRERQILRDELKWMEDGYN